VPSVQVRNDVSIHLHMQFYVVMQLLTSKISTDIAHFAVAELLALPAFNSRLPQILAISDCSGSELPTVLMASSFLVSAVNCFQFFV